MILLHTLLHYYTFLIYFFSFNVNFLGVGGDDEDDDDSGGPAEDGDNDGRTRGVDRVTPIEHLARIEAVTAPVLKTLAVPARNYMKKLHERGEYFKATL